MAEKNLPAQSISRSGLTATYYDSTAGTPVAERLVDGTITTGDQYLVQNNEETMLHVKNGGNAADFVIETVTVVDGIDLTDRTVTVPANAERFIGPFPRNIYGDTFKFAIDDVSNVEVAVLRM